jgi:hypothetical protein
MTYSLLIVTTSHDIFFINNYTTQHFTTQPIPYLCRWTS